MLKAAFVLEVLHFCPDFLVRLSLLDFSFNVTEILKILMQDAGIIHCPLFSRKTSSCPCALLKMNYCDAVSTYLSLDNDKMHLLSILVVIEPC